MNTHFFLVFFCEVELLCVLHYKPLNLHLADSVFSFLSLKIADSHKCD